MENDHHTGTRSVKLWVKHPDAILIITIIISKVLEHRTKTYVSRPEEGVSSKTKLLVSIVTETTPPTTTLIA